MRQVWITKTGGPEVLEVREAPDPEVTAGHVRVRVKYSGVNFADAAARLGLYPDAPPIPCVVGYEVSGIVDAVGAGVEGFKPGDRVLAFTRFGGYSDVVVAPRDFVYPIPDDLGFDKAAGIPVTYLTAWMMLVYLGNVRRGETVLVHAAAGGVGISALQICKLRGARVIGTASAGKHARLKELGVAHCIDYTKENFQTEVARITEGHGVDIALDAVGGKSHRMSYDSLAPLGKLMMFGASSFSPGSTRSIPAVVKGFFSMPKFKPLKLMDVNRGVFGVNLGHLWGEGAKLRGMMEEIMPHIASRALDPIIDQVFPFSKASEAHSRLHDRKNFGKILLEPVG
jgi:NADPH:quinone reductase-like Zn-dependent oxidoreductase